MYVYIYHTKSNRRTCVMTRKITLSSRPAACRLHSARTIVIPTRTVFVRRTRRRRNARRVYAVTVLSNLTKGGGEKTRSSPTTGTFYGKYTRTRHVRTRAFRRDRHPRTDREQRSLWGFRVNGKPNSPAEQVVVQHRVARDSRLVYSAVAARLAWHVNLTDEQKANVSSLECNGLERFARRTNHGARDKTRPLFAASELESATLKLAVAALAAGLRQRPTIQLN